MKGKIERAFEAQSAIVREPAPAGAAAATANWASVSSDAPIFSMIRASAFRTLGLEMIIPPSPENQNPKQPCFLTLSHEPGAITGDWVREGIVIRDNHGGDTCGRLTPAYVRDRKLGGDNIVWSASDRAKVLRADVESGVRRDISVEGDWDDKDLVRTGEKEGLPLIRAARWTPLAAALVDVRADPQVGVARSSDAAGEKPTATETKEKTPDAAPAIAAPAVVRSKPMDKTPEQIAAEEQARDKARAQANVEIMTLARTFSVPQEHVNEHILAGKSLEDFRGLVMRDYATPKAQPAKKVSEIDRSADDVTKNIPPETLARFSIRRALMGMAKAIHPAFDLPKFDDGLEREISQEAVRLIRATPEGETYVPRGLCIPWTGILGARNREGVSREFTISGGGSGSNIVAQNLLAGSHIDILRAKLVLQALGMDVISGLVGDALIPKQTGAATAEVVAETGTATDSIMTESQIKLTPHTINAISLISRRLLLQSTPAADMLVMNDLIAVVARKVQSLGLTGTGANNQPVGLLTALAAGYQGFAAITEATVATDGTPLYTELEDMMGTPEEADVDGEMKWLLRPRAFRYFKTIGRVGTTGFVPAATGAAYKDGMLADAPAMCTSALTTKYAVYGRWDSMILGLWGALDITVDPWFLVKRGGLQIVALQDIDFGYRYLPAFAWSSKFKAS